MSVAMIERNRRAVYTALSGVCNDRLLLERALAYWEANFAAQGVFRVAQYVDGLMGQIGLNPDQRRALSVALYSALTKKDGELAELPTMFRRAANGQHAKAKSAAAEPGGVGTVASRDAGAAVLARILSAMVDGTARAGQHAELIATLRDTATAIGPGATNRALEKWIEGSLADSVRCANSVRAEERAGVVNTVYIALCEVVGPVVADRILARAVEAAEQIAEAVSFPPRSLL